MSQWWAATKNVDTEFSVSIFLIIWYIKLGCICNEVKFE